mgnify:FL=1
MGMESGREILLRKVVLLPSPNSTPPQRRGGDQPLPPLTNKKVRGATVMREICRSVRPPLSPQGEGPVRSSGPAPENKAFEKPLAGHSQDTRKAPGDIPGAFLASGKIKI